MKDGDSWTKPLEEGLAPAPPLSLHHGFQCPNKLMAVAPNHSAPGPVPRASAPEVSNYMLTALSSEVGPYLYLPGRSEGNQAPSGKLAQGQGQEVASLIVPERPSLAFNRGNLDPGLLG